MSKAAWSGSGWETFSRWRFSTSSDVCCRRSTIRSPADNASSIRADAPRAVDRPCSVARPVSALGEKRCNESSGRVVTCKLARARRTASAIAFDAWSWPITRSRSRRRSVSSRTEPLPRRCLRFIVTECAEFGSSRDAQRLNARANELAEIGGLLGALLGLHHRQDFRVCSAARTATGRLPRPSAPTRRPRRLRAAGRVVFGVATLLARGLPDP
jgi:hypothetical protein